MSIPKHTHKVLIIDFGSQYTHMISKKVRDLRIFSEIIDCDDENLLAHAESSDGIILSGGPDSVVNENHLKVDTRIYQLNKPILGICYGMQLIHKDLGGTIDSKNFSEFGYCQLHTIPEHADHPLLKGIPATTDIWCSHNDSVIDLAPGFVSIAKTDICTHIAVNDDKKLYTVQFHPETSQTECGTTLLSNFVFGILKLEGTWIIQNIVERKISEIQDSVQKDNVLLALSGGVDSSVLAYLLSASLDNHQIYPLFINNGLLLSDSTEKLTQAFSEKFKNLKIIDASERFLNELEDVIEPEEKRKIIGKLFIQIFNEYIGSLQDANIKFLAQGTIYSDLIESGKKSKQSKTIKSHHNVVGLLEKHNFKVIEPLSDLFKDEAKCLGTKICVPESILNQQPFPGPGLAIRITGAVTRKKLDLLRKVSVVFREELHKRNLKGFYDQAFAVLMSQKSVGVQGDERIYDYIVALRMVKTSDFMTAEASDVDIKTLLEIGSAISNSVPGISRIVYDLTNKPPGSIEWE